MSNGNTLYLECRSGISGDMAVAALLDLGATEENLRASLAKLPVDGYELTIKKVVKNGLEVSDFDVIVEHEVPAHSHAHGHMHDQEHAHNHPHDQEHAHNHPHDQEHAHDHPHDQEHAHAHDHPHDQEHAYNHDHPHDQEHVHGHDHGYDHVQDEVHSHDNLHPHVHRSWAGIEKMLLEAELKPGVKALSLQMFRTVAEAEAKVHGKSIDEVHFHEVGAVDSIVDIVGTAICLDELNVDKVVVSELTEGCGHIRCQHGILPVPVPAVLEIAAAHGLTLRQTEQEGEMVTPTGAAIAALSEGVIPGAYRVKKVGMGAGKRVYQNTNILRAMLIEER